MNASQLSPYQVAMLIGGILLFVLAAGLIVFLTAKQRPTKPAIVILPFAILMIGFPGIKSFKGLGFELEAAVQTIEEKVRALENNPDNREAAKELDRRLTDLTARVTTETATAATAEAIAKGQEALGRTDEAVKWAEVALKKAPGSRPARLVLERSAVIKALPTDENTRMTPSEVSHLTTATVKLSALNELSPATRITLARAQLALGQTNAAVTNIETATKANTNFLRIGRELLQNPTLRPR